MRACIRTLFVFRRRKAKVWSQWIIVLPALLAVSSPALAAPGDLDTTFAGTGMLRTGFGGGNSQGHAVAVQSDGKWVMAGLAVHVYTNEFAVIRFTTNNVLDTSFGQRGKVLMVVGSPGLGNAGANAVQIQTDGQILVAGYAVVDTAYSAFTLVRYHPDGSVDTAFGTDGTGIVHTDLGQQSQITAMTLQSNGRIVVAGFLGSPGSSNAGIALARYQTNGALDTTFGIAGTIVTPGSEYDALYGVMIEPDGKIVAVGSGSGAKLAVYRFTTNGVPDTTFGGTGHVFTGVGGTFQANAVAYQTSPSIMNPAHLIAAGFLVSSETMFAVVRYNLDGSLDTTFGTGGIATNSIGNGAVFGTSVIIQNQSLQRKIVVGGYGGNSPNLYFAAARYTPLGALDTTFGTNGTGTVTLPVAGDGAAYGMASSSGEFVLAGYSGVYPHYEFTAARLTANGVPDNSFGNGGVLNADVLDLDSQANAVAIQTNGAIVLAGGQNGGELFALARSNPDGSLDSTFGSQGKVTTAVSTNLSTAYAVQIQPDAKIVAAGSAGGFAVARYLANGSLDASFGSAGTTFTSLLGVSQAFAVALQPDGKIVLAGSAFGATYLFGLARYTTNGTLDSSFGSGGVVTTGITSGGEEATAVQIQTDGKIVAAGLAIVGFGNVFALARYNTNGALDMSFGSFGRVTTAFASDNVAAGWAMAIQPDGRIIVAGQAGIYFALARYTTNGLLDASFGNGGQVLTPVGSIRDVATAVALQSDGKIVAAGVSRVGTNDQFAVVRYNPDGSLDNSYGVGGQMLVSFADGGSDTGAAVALDQIGRVVVAGNANNLFGVARLAAEPLLKFTSINHLSTGQTLLHGLGVPAANNSLDAAPNLSPGSFSRLDSVAADAGGFWQYQDTNTVGLNRRFYRLSYP